jgi:hypothetical protein
MKLGIVECSLHTIPVSITSIVLHYSSALYEKLRLIKTVTKCVRFFRGFILYLDPTESVNSCYLGSCHQGISRPQDSIMEGRCEYVE